MDKRALEKAAARIRIAKKAVMDLEACKSHDEFADHWYVFLVAFKNVYTVLEQGAKPSAQARQWFGAKKQARKNDQLLQYLFEARNDDEHGLDSSVMLRHGQHDIGIAQDGFSNDLIFNGGPFKDVRVTGFGTAASFQGSLPKDMTVTALDNKPVLVRITPSSSILVPVKARGDRLIPPPQEHLGTVIPDPYPLAIAELALAYLETLLREAEGLA